MASCRGTNRVKATTVFPTFPVWPNKWPGADTERRVSLDWKLTRVSGWTSAGVLWWGGKPQEAHFVPDLQSKVSLALRACTHVVLHRTLVVTVAQQVSSTACMYAVAPPVFLDPYFPHAMPPCRLTLRRSSTQREPCSIRVLCLMCFLACVLCSVTNLCPARGGAVCQRISLVGGACSPMKSKGPVVWCGEGGGN